MILPPPFTPVLNYSQVYDLQYSCAHLLCKFNLTSRMRISIMLVTFQTQVLSWLLRNQKYLEWIQSLANFVKRIQCYWVKQTEDMLENELQENILTRTLKVKIIKLIELIICKCSKHNISSVQCQWATML